MTPQNLTELLTALQSGGITPADAAMKLATEDLGFAKLDLARRGRCGFPEFIYGAGKTKEQTCEIMKRLASLGEPALATRLSEDALEFLWRNLPDAELDFLAKTAFLRIGVRKKTGTVVVLCAGTSDLPVAREAVVTLEACGYSPELLTDVGVAGIHRLLAVVDQLRKADVLLAIAGMEGALPSVVAGLVSCPVIAVPTSVGYGASMNGLTAMFAMLNSCASGVTVVNIDNGFGGACAAVRILNGLERIRFSS